MKRRFEVLVVTTVALAFLTAPVFGQLFDDLFWIGGTGQWHEPFEWSSTPGGLPGAGPPNNQLGVTIESLSPITVSFDTDGAANGIDVDGDVEFELNGHELGVGRVGTNLGMLRSSAAENTQNLITLRNGTVDATSFLVRAIELNSRAKIVVEPTVNTTLKTSFFNNNGNTTTIPARLDVIGFDAEILLQGNLTMDAGLVPRAVVNLNTGGVLRVDGGSLDLFGHAQLDVFAELVVDAGSLQVFGSMEIDGSSDLTVNGGFAAIDEGFDVGLDHPAEVVVSNAAALFTGGPTVLGTNLTGTGRVTIQDVGSRWEIRDTVTIGGAGVGNASVNNGGQLLVLDPAANVMLGTSTSGSGQITVDSGLAGGSTFQSQASVFLGGNDSAAGGSGHLLVNQGSSANIDGLIKVWGQGRVEANGGSIASSQLIVTTGGRLIVDQGGSIEANIVDLQTGANLSGFDDGTLIVRGAPGLTGSLLIGSTSFGFGSDSGLPTIHLDDATSFVTDWTIANFPGASAKTLVEGPLSRLQASNDLRVTGNNTQTHGEMLIQNGGLAEAGDDITMAFTSTSTATVIVDGIASNGRRSTLRNNAQGQDEEIEIGRAGQATLSVTNGGLVQSLNNISLASFPTAQATVTVGGQLATISASNDMAVGGFATIETAGGTASLIVNNQGRVLVGNRLKVYSQGTVDNNGVVNIGNSMVATSDGDLVVGPAGELAIAGGTVRSHNVELDAAATLDLQGGTLHVDGGRLELNRSSLIYGSATGIPIIELTNGATSDVTFAWHIGSTAGTNGRTTLRNPGTRLENTGGGGGADLVAGVSGTGTLEVFDGAVVDFNDDVTAGSSAGSSGTLFVSGVESSNRATIRASGGTNNDVVIGFNGSGSLDIVGGGLVAADDDVNVGLASGSDGVVTISGSQSGFASSLRAVDDFTIGVAELTAGPLTNTGQAVVAIHPGGEAIVGDTTAVGPDDTLAILGGTLRTGQLNIESDPARLQWTSGTLALTASSLAIETGGTLDRVVRVDNGMMLSAQGLRIGSDGVLLLGGGHIDGGAMTMQIDDGGFLGGNGTIEGTGFGNPFVVENHGRISPNDLLQINGPFVQGADGEIVMQVNFAEGGTPHIHVAADATLAGLLEINAGSEQDPTVAGTIQDYRVLSAAALQGAFDTVIYDLTDLTALVAGTGSFNVYVGTAFNGVDGLFRGLEYATATGEVIFSNYLAIPGDANGDRVVDGQDFIIWNTNKFQSGTNWLSADFNRDGITDGQDFIVWNNHKFTSVSSMRPVPESMPVTLPWTALLLLAIPICRRSGLHGPRQSAT